ncbi:MAG: hypothetical protein AAF721_24780 [Myxococcota bacterium]
MSFLVACGAKPTTQTPCGESLGVCGGSDEEGGDDGSAAATTTGAGSETTAADGASGPMGTTDSTSSGGESTTGDGVMDPKFDVATMPDAAPAEPTVEAVVFAHTSSVLYRLDPDSLAIEEVAPFGGCGSVVDIAVDRDNNIFASASGIYEVDAETAECAQIATGSFGNNLSFVPPGVLHPEREILVTYSGTQYRSLDTETGEITDHGTIPYSVSGDLVSIKDGPTYVSVNGPSGLDHLLLVDPATGELIFDAGAIASETSVYGLGYWGGTIYGFSSNGNITEIAEQDDGTIIATVIEDAGVSFWGAGSSTFAPIVPEG